MLLLFAYSEEEKRVCFSVGMGANVSRACSSKSVTSDKIRIVREYSWKRKRSDTLDSNTIDSDSLFPDEVSNETIFRNKCTD